MGLYEISVIITDIQILLQPIPQFVSSLGLSRSNPACVKENPSFC